MSKTSKIISIILVFSIIITVIVASVYKVYSNHKNDLLKVVNQKMAEAGEKCNREGKCESEFTLGFLIENGYIDEQVHPITKEYVDKDSKITCDNYNCFSNIN